MFGCTNAIFILLTEASHARSSFAPPYEKVSLLYGHLPTQRRGAVATPMKNFIRSRDARSKAAALIIVLAFVVLLAGLVLAYFTRTTTDRQMGQSSYNDTSADLLARSALDIVVGDFQQEIVNGSTATYLSDTNGNTTKIYIPINALNMVPQHSGDLKQLAPNLIRRSIRSDGINYPGVPSRASAVNSTRDASANGRSISTSRWNSHYLIPLGNPSLSPTPSTSPIPDFIAPDWVIATRAGPTPFASWTSTLADPTSNNYAVGRYAYAVYDEGGLLDINVAGFPTPVPATPIPEYLTDFGRKGVLAWADLTAIASPSGTPFTNKIVGVRNYATVGQNNTSNWGFTFLNTPHVSNFINYFLGGGIGQQKVGTGSRDFGAVNPISAPDGRTDQNFITRAELINFFKTAYSDDVAKMNMLQYVGTFSREQNKPSLPLTPAWPSPSPSPSPSWQRVVVPQRFYIGNLNEVVASGNAADILRDFGLVLVIPTPTVTPSPGRPCDNQLRWNYVGALISLTATPSPTPTATPTGTPTIPLCGISTWDFFQYINYALFGRSIEPSDDSTHVPYALGIGASLIDLYDADGLLTGIYYGSSAATCDISPPINACLVYGAEQSSGSPSTVRSQAPTCFAAPTPDTFTSSFVPPVNLPTRTVGDFGWAYSILNAANNHNTNANPKFVVDFKDAYDPVNSDPTRRNPDPALLDFFTYNCAKVRSGVVSLNTRQVPVLTAILKSALYQGTSSTLNQAQATSAATSIVTDATNGTIINPAMSRADIARFVATLVAAGIKPFNNTPNQDIQDVIARALSETTQTRTWGLLIDLVAQTGHYKPNATSLQNDFVVEGEKRYWLHIAIDRFDGSIVGQQLEEVTE